MALDIGVMAIIHRKRTKAQIKPDDPNRVFHEENRNEFLRIYAQVGSISKVCQIMGIGRRTVQMYAQKHPEYRERMNEAKEECTERMEAEAIRRGTDGYEEPVFYKGVQVSTIRKFSDILLIFMLKALRPEVYRENTNVHIPEGITVKLVKDFRQYKARQEKIKNGSDDT